MHDSTSFYSNKNEFWISIVNFYHFYPSWHFGFIKLPIVVQRSTVCKMFLNIYSSIETRTKTLQYQTLQTLCSFTLSGNSTKIPAKKHYVFIHC